MGIKVRSEVLRRLRASLRTLGLLANPRTSSNRSGLPAPPTSHMNSLNIATAGHRALGSSIMQAREALCLIRAR